MKRVPALSPHHRRIVPWELRVRRAPVEGDATYATHVTDVAGAPRPRADAVPGFDVQDETGGRRRWRRFRRRFRRRRAR